MAGCAAGKLQTLEHPCEPALRFRNTVGVHLRVLLHRPLAAVAAEAPERPGGRRPHAPQAAQQAAGVRGGRLLLHQPLLQDPRAPRPHHLHRAQRQSGHLCGHGRLPVRSLLAGPPPQRPLQPQWSNCGERPRRRAPPGAGGGRGRHRLDVCGRDERPVRHRRGADCGGRHQHRRDADHRLDAGPDQWCGDT